MQPCSPFFRFGIWFGEPNSCVGHNLALYMLLSPRIVMMRTGCPNAILAAVEAIQSTLTVFWWHFGQELCTYTFQ